VHHPTGHALAAHKRGAIPSWGAIASGGPASSGDVH
jgi:hypothetical protein